MFEGNKKVKSTARFYNPIKFKFVKVTTHSTNAEVARLEENIKKLQASKLNIGGADISVYHKFLKYMREKV